MWKVRRPEKSQAEVEKEKGRKEMTKRLLLKEGVSTLFLVTFFDEFSQAEDSDSCGNSWVTFWLTPVVCLSA